MKISLLKRLSVLFLLLFGSQAAFSQVVTVPDYTACPNQSINVCPTWNNVFNITYSLVVPAGAGSVPNLPAGSGVVPPCFDIYHPAPNGANVNYTVWAFGTNVNGPITSSVVFNLQTTPPPTMPITNVNTYCYGTNATFIAPNGGVNYTVTGPGGLVSGSPFQSNVINFGPLTSPANNGNYVITAVIAGCTQTGVTSVSVSPNTQINISSTQNICEGANVTLTLTGTLANGTNYQWTHNNVALGAAPPNVYTKQGITVNDAGVYFLNADLQYNGIFCPRTASVQVNVVQISQVVAGASPNTALCQGASLNLTGNAAFNPTYLWKGPQSFLSSAQNPLISPVNVLNSGTYSVTAFFTGFLITCTTSAVVNVTVTPTSIPQISSPGSVCQGTNNITLSATSVYTPQSYSWSGPFWGTSNTPGQTVFLQVPGPGGLQPDASGTYYVTANFGYAGPVQCITTASTQLNVIPTNTIQVTPPGVVCSPNNANLQAYTTGANLYTWAGPNGFATPGANVIVYYPTATANGVYTVTAYFGNGNLTCKSTATVALQVSPVLNFSLKDYSQLCFGDTLTLVGPPGATSYTWTSSTGLTTNTKDIHFSAIQPNHAGTYTLQVSLGPCNSGDETTVDVITPIHFTLTPLPRTICKGDTIVLEAGATGGSQVYGYKWNPEVYLQSPSAPKQIAVPLGSVLYNLTVWDTRCANIYSISTSFLIKVNTAPEPKLELKSEGCEPLTLFLNSKTQKDASIITYDFGGILQYQGDSITRRLNAGTYDLNVHTVGKNGCKETFKYPYPIVVHPKPGTDIFWKPEIPTTTDEIIFTSESQHGPITYYNWQFSGGVNQEDTSKVPPAPGADTTNAPNPRRIYSKFGKFPVVLITKNDKECVDTVVKFIDVIDDLQIFVPNTFTPNDDGVNDVFNVKGYGMKTDNFAMEILDRWGTIIFVTRDINMGWDGKVKGQPAKDGSYIYKIRVVGLNGEGRKDLTGYVNLIR